MIDESKTLYIYGYTSDELSPHSGKPIVAVCDGCGEMRVMPKNWYKDLCKTCAHNTPEYLEIVTANSIKQFADHEARKKSSDDKKAYYETHPDAIVKARETTVKQFSDQSTRDAHSDIMKAYYAEHPISEDERAKRSAIVTKRYEDQHERDKTSAATKKRYAEMDDPGDEICYHHYIYDHSDLTKYTMEITRSRHSKMHWNMWKSGIEVPHINMSGCE